MLTFSYNIHVINAYVKKKNCFVFIIHQVNKHGITRGWFTEAGVTDFKSGALRTTPNVTRAGFKLSVS